ncbi:MAG: hypothetical protein WCK00_18540 [Deltaproteobacteria bacterium]
MPEDKSVFQRIGDAVVDFAPGIATILAATGIGAPAAAAVGAVGALGRAMGLGSAAKPEDVLKAISTDPEIRLKAMIAENDFKVKQRDQELEGLRLQLSDVKSAREREMAVKDDVNKFLAYGIVTSFVTMIAFIIFGYAKADSAIIGTLIGYLSAKAEQIISYYFGSSRGSQLKTDLLAKADAIR